MAITKIKPIRGTVNKALAYILDPQKTDDAFYVSSYGCAASDAAAKEFEWTRNLAVQQGMQRYFAHPQVRWFYRRECRCALFCQLLHFFYELILGQAQIDEFIAD